MSTSEPMLDGFSSSQMSFQCPMQGPGVQYPGGAAYGAGDCPAPNQINVSAKQSVHLDGSDLPHHDIASLRFYYNLGVQTYNNVMKAFQYPVLATYGFDEEPTSNQRPTNTGIPTADPTNPDGSGLNLEGSYPPSWAQWPPPDFQADRSLCQQHPNYMQCLPAYPYQPIAQNSTDLTYYVPVRLMNAPGHRHC